jgi:hypothetical protein
VGSRDQSVTSARISCLTKTERIMPSPHVAAARRDALGSRVVDVDDQKDALGIQLAEGPLVGVLEQLRDGADVTLVERLEADGCRHMAPQYALAAATRHH